MCIDLKVIYGCGHYERQFIECPTYQKKKSSFRNRLFGGQEGRKDCGSVRRERPMQKGSCHKCSIRVEGLVSERVGNSARLVSRPHMYEGFTKMLEPKGYQQHGVISSKNSVWCPEYYLHRKRVVKASYGRGSAPAPPVAPARPRQPADNSHGKSSSSRNDTSNSIRVVSQSRPRTWYPTRGWKEARKGHDKSGHGVLGLTGYRSPALGPAFSGPLQRPVEPAPAWKPRGLPNQGSNGPPPRIDQPPMPNIDPAMSYDCVQALPMAGHRYATTPPPRPAHHQPRMRLPKPAFEVYLEAQREHERSYVSRPPAAKPPLVAEPPRTMPAPASKQTRKPLGWLARLNLLGDAGSDSLSDVSFACAGAREIERIGRTARR